MVGARELFWAQANDVRLHGAACGRYDTRSRGLAAFAWVNNLGFGLIGRDSVLASGGVFLIFPAGTSPATGPRQHFMR